MAKTTLKDQPKSKEQPQKVTLDEAKQRLREAQRQYNKLIKRKVSLLPDDDARQKHNKACSKALAAKRHAVLVVEAVQANKPAPKPEDAVETKELTQ